MDNGEVAHLPGKSEVAKPLFVRFGQLLTRPVDGHLGESVEIAGRFLERGLLVMVPFHYRAFELLDDLDALMRIRVVTDDIAEADVMSAIALARVGQDGLGRFEICVEVAENGDAHGNEKRPGRFLVGYPLIWWNVQLNFEFFQAAEQRREPLVFAAVVECPQLRIGLALASRTLG